MYEDIKEEVLACINHAYDRLSKHPEKHTLSCVVDMYASIELTSIPDEVQDVLTCIKEALPLIIIDKICKSSQVSLEQWQNICYSHLSYLPDETLAEISAKVISQESAKRLPYFILNDLWESRFKQHFPRKYRIIHLAETSVTELNWEEKFKKQSKKEYDELPQRYKELYFHVKDQSLAAIKKQNVREYELINVSRALNINPLLYWVRGNKVILDYFHSIYINGRESKEDKTRDLIFLIACGQPLSSITSQQEFRWHGRDHLARAAYYQYFELCKYILEKSTLSIQNFTKGLIVAIETNNLAICKLFFEAYIQKGYCRDWDKSECKLMISLAFNKAIEYGNFEFLQLLSDEYQIFIFDCKKDPSYLQTAIDLNYLKIIKLLVSIGFKVTKSHIWSATPKIGAHLMGTYLTEHEGQRCARISTKLRQVSDRGELKAPKEDTEKKIEKTNKTIHNILLKQSLFNLDKDRRQSYNAACVMNRSDYQKYVSSSIRKLQAR